MSHFQHFRASSCSQPEPDSLTHSQNQLLLVSRRETLSLSKPCGGGAPELSKLVSILAFAQSSASSPDVGTTGPTDRPADRFFVLAPLHTRKERGECGRFALLHARSRRSSSPRPLGHAWHDQAEEDGPSQGRGEAN